MELATITMDKSEARKRFLEYRQSVRERHTIEDEQIMRGYRALARGSQVIDLGSTIRSGGIHTIITRNSEVRLPRLAVMRADQQWCAVATSLDGSVTFHPQGYPKSTESRNLVRLPADTLPRTSEYSTTTHWQFRAMVPPVPPALRPADKIGNYHILWEAEWQKSPPVDPALLKHIGGDLYAVVAIWDLTELERTVLMGRFR